MAVKGLQLSELFDVVLNAMKNKRQDINALEFLVRNK